MTGLIASSALSDWTMLFAIGGLGLVTLMLGYLVLHRRKIERHKGERDSMIKRLVGELLKMCGGETPSPTLQTANPALRLEAAIYLHQLVRGGERAALSKYIEQERLLEPVMSACRRGSTNRRTEAVRKLQWISEPRAHAVLLEVLTADADRRVRLEAAGALARLGALPGPDELIDALQLAEHPPIQLHRGLFRTIAPTQGRRLVELLATDLSDPLRALLVDAIGWTGDYTTRGEIARALRHPSPEVRLAALGAAMKVNHPSLTPWVVLLLDDKAAEVRSRAVEAYTRLGNRSAVDAIEHLRSDPSALVRHRAGKAYDQIAKVA